MEALVKDKKHLQQKLLLDQMVIFMFYMKVMTVL